jgi:hypothetical protein
VRSERPLGRRSDRDRRRPLCASVPELETARAPRRRGRTDEAGAVVDSTARRRVGGSLRGVEHIQELSLADEHRTADELARRVCVQCFHVLRPRIAAKRRRPVHLGSDALAGVGHDSIAIPVDAEPDGPDAEVGELMREDGRAAVVEPWVGIVATPPDEAQGT